MIRLGGLKPKSMGILAKRERGGGTTPLVRGWHPPLPIVSQLPRTVVILYRRPARSNHLVPAHILMYLTWFQSW